MHQDESFGSDELDDSEDYLDADFFDDEDESEDEDPDATEVRLVWSHPRPLQLE